MTLQPRPIRDVHNLPGGARTRQLQLQALLRSKQEAAGTDPRQPGRSSRRPATVHAWAQSTSLGCRPKWQRTYPRHLPQLNSNVGKLKSNSGEFKRNVGVLKSLTLTLIFSLIAVGVFSIYQVSRGQISSLSGVPKQFFGYFIGSYNRFGIQIQYDKPLEFSSGYNIISALNAIPGFSSLLNLNQIWYDQFGYMKPIENFSVWYGYGIDPHFNVITAFGYTFQDFGYAGPVFFVLYGLIVRVSYNSYRRRRLYGIISYPAILWSVFELRGKLEIVYFNVQSVVILAFIVSLCFRLILERNRWRYNA